MKYYANVYEAINDPIVFVSRTFICSEVAKDAIKEDLNVDCSFVNVKFIKMIEFDIP